MRTIVIVCVALIALQGSLGQRQDAKPIKAFALLALGGTGIIQGNVTFTQNGCGQPVLLEVHVSGLLEGPHGFHIHERGDLSGGCATLGAHYNPDKLYHGGPDNEIRHVGDLGNLKANALGVVETTFSDALISLTGLRSIIGRGVIVHEDVDDLGKGNHPDSLTTGNAGARFACGIVGIMQDDNEQMPYCGSGVAIAAGFLSMLTAPMLLARG